jgi:hypothetical protein
MRNAALRCIGCHGLLRMSVGVACLTLIATIAAAEETPPLLQRIEEDWEMQLIEPRPENNSPQVAFFVTPSSSEPSLYFQVQMNYGALEDYSPGGFHVAAVQDESYLDEARSGTRKGLSVDSDTIVWTNVMAVINDKLYFAIKNGQCSDWGSFGGPDYLVNMPARTVTNLSTYSHDQSLAEVDIGFGGNRVSSIQLKTVRLYYSDGRVETVAVNKFVER